MSDISETRICTTYTNSNITQLILHDKINRKQRGILSKVTVRWNDGDKDTSEDVDSRAAEGGLDNDE